MRAYMHTIAHIYVYKYIHTYIQCLVRKIIHTSQQIIHMPSQDQWEDNVVKAAFAAKQKDKDKEYDLIVEDQIEFISHELLKGTCVHLVVPVVGVVCRMKLNKQNGGGKVQ